MALVVTGVAAAEGALKSVHDDWQVRCDTLPATQEEQCALTQSVVAEDKTDVWLTVSVLKTAKSRVMRVVAPLGVVLPSGLRLKIDQVDVGRAGFVRCLPNGCVTEVVMDDNLLKQAKSIPDRPNTKRGLCSAEWLGLRDALTFTKQSPARKGEPMPSHKFNIGDAVLFNSRVSRNAPWGVYEVVKGLPGNGNPEYRVKSANEEHHRVARESKLTRA